MWSCSPRSVRWFLQVRGRPAGATYDETHPMSASESNDALSKTLASQASKGNQSYYYWHSSVPKGELAAPTPTPQRLDLETRVAEQPPATIDSYAFVDDETVVKVYITLEGPLAGLAAADVDAEYAERSLRVLLRPPGGRPALLAVAELSHIVRPEGCKHKVTKSGKLIITLDKANSHQVWKKLRR